VFAYAKVFAHAKVFVYALVLGLDSRVAKWTAGLIQYKTRTKSNRVQPQGFCKAKASCARRIRSRLLPR
jgi:hypothetical protein